jgi:hypothetical protein
VRWFEVRHPGGDATPPMPRPDATAPAAP